MKIGIDISQLAYSNTGVANYTLHLVEHMLKQDKKNEYILFYSSLRQNFKLKTLNIKDQNNVKIKKFRMPPTLLDFLWNKLHILPIEMFVGDVDLFITSDWTEPPTKNAKKATIIHDLIVYKMPQETDKKIISVQKRKLKWVKNESDMLLCNSEATKKDAMSILGIKAEKFKVIYPGV